MSIRLQIPTQISFTMTLPVVNSGVVRIRFLSAMSVHTTTRFVVHYNTLPPASRPCDGLLFAPGKSSWHHVAATVDQVNGSAASMKIYVDGTLQAQSIVSRKETLLKPLALVGRMGLAIGRSDPGRAPPLTGPFVPSNADYNTGHFDVRKGSDSFWAAGLDEIRLWNVSRSAEEILLGLNTTCKAGGGGSFGRFSPVLCYSFDRMDLHKDDGIMYFTDLGLAPPVEARAVVGDRFAEWCTTLGDNGLLVDKVVATNAQLLSFSGMERCH